MAKASIPPQRNPISIRGMMKGQHTQPRKENPEGSVYSNAQQKVRELLLQRAKGKSINIDDIRDLATTNLSETGEPFTSPKKPRLSLAKAKGVHLPKIDMIAMKHSLKTQKESVEKKPRPELQNSIAQKGPSHQPLKDSIYFLTDREYETYLQDELDRQGLFRELFEQFKVLYISSQDIHALMGVFEHLGDLNLTPCQIELEKAETFRVLGDWDKAFLYLDKAIRIEPESIAAMRALAFYHKYKEEYDLSMLWFNRWAKLEPDLPDIDYQLGLLSYRVNQHDLARGHLNRCLTLDTGHLMARSLLGKLKA
jgi:tetratricopeptide (TPR) repeat protein